MRREFLNTPKLDKKKRQRDIMENIQIKYADQMICFQEIPDEISLSFSITGCKRNCKGCHSQYLREEKGIEVKSVLNSFLKKYDGIITCVLFMGGDDELHKQSLFECANIGKNNGLKIALYSGATECDDDIFELFDYVKVGPYIEELGGLKSKKTNQRLYKINHNTNTKEDITYLFWKKIE